MQPVSANVTFQLKWEANHLICHLVKYYCSVDGVQSASSFASMIDENILAGLRNVFNIPQMFFDLASYFLSFSLCTDCLIFKMSYG